MRLLTALAAALAAAAVLAVPAAPRRDATAPTWSGTWSTDWGAMQLVQKGSSVTGTYTHDSGHIRGTVSGVVLRGTWNEAPTRKGPRDAGPFEWTISSDGKSFAGKWAYADAAAGAWAGTWVGKCTGGACSGATLGPWPALPDALVSLASVANGCGGGVAGTAERWGDTSTYLNTNNPLGTRYTVNFRMACNLHDAGYSGAKVADPLHGGTVTDFFTWTQLRVDQKFLDDMRMLCDRQIPATATGALADCKGRGGKTSFGAVSRYNAVRAAGHLFFRKRPNLRGVWSAGPDAPALGVSQSLRSVRATWKGGTGDSAVSGEFRGTMISRDQDSIVRGFARVTKADGTVTQSAMTIVADPDTPDRIRVGGPGPTGVLTRA